MVWDGGIGHGALGIGNWALGIGQPQGLPLQRPRVSFSPAPLAHPPHP
jgi:hypothetical protein